MTSEGALGRLRRRNQQKKHRKKPEITPPWLGRRSHKARCPGWGRGTFLLLCWLNWRDHVLYDEAYLARSDKFTSFPNANFSARDGMLTISFQKTNVHNATLPHCKNNRIKSCRFEFLMKVCARPQAIKNESTLYIFCFNQILIAYVTILIIIYYVSVSLHLCEHVTISFFGILILTYIYFLFLSGVE